MELLCRHIGMYINLIIIDYFIIEEIIRGSFILGKRRFISCLQNVPQLL